MGWFEGTFARIKLILIPLMIIMLAVAVYSLAENQDFFGGEELSSPSDWIKEEQIKVYNDKVILNIENPTWAGFTNTNSMDPFIDEHSNTIEVSPKDADVINVGDVISYHYKNSIIIHRVIEKGKDSEGIYYIVKGDNNRFNDPYKIRFEDVKGVVVAVIY